MSKAISLLAAFICAVLFVNVYGQGVNDEVFNIFSSDGKYKPGK